MRYALLALVVSLLLACDSSPQHPSPRSLPSSGPSVVFGPTDAPTGGRLVVGVLIAPGSSERLVDLIGEDVWRAFLEAEAVREEDDVPAEGVEEDLPEEEVDVFERDTSEWEWMRAFRQCVAQKVEIASRVRVVFRDLLATECFDEPIVLATARDLHEGEVAALRGYVAGGGRLLVDRPDVGEGEVGTSCPGVLPQGPEAVGPLVEACLEAIGTSPLVHRFPHDPLEVVLAERRGDEVRVRLRARPAEASLRGPADEVVARVLPEHDAELRFPCPDPALDPYTHRLVAAWSGPGITLRRAWRIVDLVGTAERRVFATRHVERGCAFAPRVLFLNTLTGKPVVGREETIALVRGETVLATATGVSGPAGTLDLHLDVPEGVEPGPAELRVGEDRFGVEIGSGVRICVVTDRSLYRPTDDVHVRVMVHDVARGRPIAGRAVTFRCEGVEKRVETSPYGIASTCFRLREARPGSTAIEVGAGGATARAPFMVRAFETPAFLLALEPETLTLRPGEEAPVTLVARHVNGSPMAGIRVWAWGDRHVHTQQGEGVTDEEGRFAFTVKARAGTRSGTVTVLTIAPDGRSGEQVIPIEVLSEEAEPGISLTALDDPVTGLPCRFELRAPAGCVVTVEVPASEPRTLDVDSDGCAILEITPRDKETAVRLTRAGAEPVLHRLEAHVRPAGCPVLIPGCRVATVGETLDLALHGEDGPVYVDVVRGRTVLRSLSAVVEGGRGELAVPLTPDLAGVLTLRVWHIDGEDLMGSWVHVLVVRGRSLKVEAGAGRAEYRPGETAVVDVRVTDREGRPTAAVLGYWAVDEALLQMAPWPIPDEEVFDVLGPSPSREVVTLATLAEHGDAMDGGLVRRVLGRIRIVRKGKPIFDIRHRTEPDRGKRWERETAECLVTWLEALRRAYVEAFEKIPLEELRTAGSFREILLGLVRRGCLDPARLSDPWGTPIRVGAGFARWCEPISERAYWIRYGTPCGSPGPDLEPGTDDDLFFVWRPHSVYEFDGRLGRFLALVADRAQLGGPLGPVPFWGPAANHLIGLGGGAGGAFGGRGGSRDLGSGGGGRRTLGTLHVRKDFSPTLCFVPEAIVGPDGKARLGIVLKDSITTWRMRLVASAPDGATGVGETAIRVSQPLHVDPWIATHLTVGDELELPVAIHNETDEEMPVRLALYLSDELACVGGDRAVVTVGPHSSTAHTFRLRAVARGTASVRIDAVSPDAQDAVERIVHVHSNARDVVDVVNGSVTVDRPWQAALPVLAANVPSEHRVSVYPTPLAEMQAGFEGLIAQPHGCFEQVSSTLLPMVLAIDYMKLTNQIRPEIEARALACIADGLECLRGFEVKEEAGGFSLFGNAPARFFLTALGLQEFCDIARVHAVDADLIGRTAQYLCSKQQEDGSWAPERRGSAHATDARLRAAFHLTAYVARALARSGRPNERALAWLEANAAAVRDPYSLALAALAFQAGDPGAEEARRFVRRLVAVLEKGGREGGWTPHGPTGIGARGRCAAIETTALAAQALLADGRHPALTRRALDHLVRARDGRGRFGTTRSTALALEALIAAEVGRTPQGDVRLRLTQGERELGHVDLCSTPTEVRHIDLGDLGGDPVSLSIRGDGMIRATLARKRWEPWSDLPELRGRVDLQVRYPAETVHVGRRFEAEVTVRNRTKAKGAQAVTVEVGIPPGCTVEPRDVRGEGAARIERAERAIVIYLETLDPGEERTFTLGITPRYELDVVTAPSKAYEYYVPEEAVLVPPKRVRAVR